MKEAPLILSSYLVFNKLEAKINAEEGYTEVRKVLGSVKDLLNLAEAPYLSNKNAAKMIFETAKASFESSKGAFLLRHPVVRSREYSLA